MCRRILFLLCGLCAVASAARAQFSVQLAVERDTRLLYEPIPVIVTVRNISGHTIELGGPDRSPWISFLITDEAGATISSVAPAPQMEAAQVAPGRTLSRTIDLLPYYDLRQRGTFTVRAFVSGDGTRVFSAPTQLTILTGRQVWKQTVGLPVPAGQTNEEYRTYSLVTLRVAKSNLLYIGVEDDTHNLVYGMILLGEFLAVGEPEAKIDAAGDAHVLYRSGPRSFSYAEVSAGGKTLNRAVYSDLLSLPRLATGDDGSVAVAGGEQTYPRVEHIMTEAEVNPPAPPPEKPPKKKWWWPFGPAKSTASSTTTTNAPTTNFHQ